jgi:hypothetical protein
MYVWDAKIIIAMYVLEDIKADFVCTKSQFLVLSMYTYLLRAFTYFFTYALKHVLNDLLFVGKNGFHFEKAIACFRALKYSIC